MAAQCRAKEIQSGAAAKADQNRYCGLTDAALITALGKEDPFAFVEIVSRYQALLFRCARNLGVDSPESGEWVSELMHDVVLALLRPGAKVPKSLGGYFVRSSRNKAYAAHRAAVRRRAHENDAALESQLACSGKTADDDSVIPSLAPGVAKLIAKIEYEMNSGERELLDWSSEAVPLRLIAEWLGISRAAAGQRVARLKQRLRLVAETGMADFSQEEEMDVRRFFRRRIAAQTATRLRNDLTDAMAASQPHLMNLPSAIDHGARHAF